MDSVRKPLHEVISEKLQTAHMGIIENGNPEDVAVASVLLQVLQASNMPADAARKIAEDREDLPNLLGMVTGAAWADIATVALDNLRSRQDQDPKRPRVQLDFSPEAYQRLKEMVEESNSGDIPNLFRDALRVYEEYLLAKKDESQEKPNLLM